MEPSLGLARLRPELLSTVEELIRLDALGISRIGVASNIAASQASPLASILLMQRQLEIVGLLATGLNDKAIGRALGIAEKTVRNQLGEVYRRLDINN